MEARREWKCLLARTILVPRTYLLASRSKAEPGDISPNSTHFPCHDLDFKFSRRPFALLQEIADSFVEGGGYGHHTAAAAAVSKRRPGCDAPAGGAGWLVLRDAEYPVGAQEFRLLDKTASNDNLNSCGGCFAYLV